MSELIVSDSPSICWRNRVNFFILVLAMLALLPFTHAGGLGVAPIAAIVGGVGLLTSCPAKIKQVPIWCFTFFAFIVWAALTALWSPYIDSQSLSNPVKLLLGAPLFLGCVLSIKSSHWHQALRYILIFVTLLGLGLLLVDLMNDYAVTDFFDPIKPGEVLQVKHNEAYGNLANAISIWTLLLAPVMVLVNRYMPLGRISSIGLAICLLVAIRQNQFAVGNLAVVAVLVMMFLAYKKPGLALKIAITIAILTIILAPVFGYVLGHLPNELVAKVPISWEHRLEMWPYTAQKILENPLWGNGFDAVRTFDETFVTNSGVELKIVSLHPHNAGLHIWVETGLIGACLACLTLFFLGRSLLSFIDRAHERAMSVTGFIVAATIISNVSYGVWQEWWWATIIFIAACLQFVPTTAD